MHRSIVLSVACALLAASVGCGGDEPLGTGPIRNPGDTGDRDSGVIDRDVGSDVVVLDVGGDTGSMDTGSIDTATDAPLDTVDPSRFGGLAGTVWAPGNAPGMVGSGQEIPVSGAVVYLTTSRPPPIPRRAYCAACTTLPSRAVLSGNDGSFVIEGYTAGTWWLVIEKGQFRREVEVQVTEGTLTPLSADVTTLPSDNDPDAGRTTPRIALAAGSYDHLEDILGKMGMGDVDSDGIYIPMSATGAIDVYANGGDDFGSASVGNLGELVNDLDRLLDYHILFIPCSGDAYTTELYDQAVLRNLRNYVAAGGNLYVTDWSGEWHDNVFPEQIELRSSFLESTDTPASAYDRGSDTWNTSQFGDADGDSYDTPNAEAVDSNLFAWLHGQFGPTAHSDTPSTFDAAMFEVEGNWNTVDGVHSVEVGVDDRGEPIVDQPHVWVRGGRDFSPEPKLPLTVSYEPVGCGRVLFSTYHTTDDRHRGLAPQERVLLYLIMEIGTCRDPKI